MLKKNMNNIDRVIRVIIAIVFVYFGLVDTGWTNSEIIPLLLGFMGAANFIFASSGICPLYQLAGLDFARQENK